MSDLLSGLARETRTPLLAAVEGAGELGLALYLVGGLVRDLLLGRDSRDLDLVVVGDELRFAERLGATVGVAVTPHPSFLTATLRLPNGVRIDVARARDESYARPGALPEVAPAGLEEDLARRDFTVNAIALHLAPEPAGELIDPHGGRADLADRQLRVLHPDSFVDDPTRLFRGLELEARLGFGMDPETQLWAREAVRQGALGTISAERLRRELYAALGGGHPRAVLDRLVELGVLTAIDVEIAYDDDQRQRLGLALGAAAALGGESADVPALIVSFLAGGLAESGRRRLAGRLALSGEETESLIRGPEQLRRTASLLAEADTPPHLAVEALEALPGVLLPLLAARDEALVKAWLSRYIEEMRGLTLEIGGGDLLALGFEPGPEIGRALRETRRARLDGRLTAGEELPFALEVLRRGREEDE